MCTSTRTVVQLYRYTKADWSRNNLHRHLFSIVRPLYRAMIAHALLSPMQATMIAS
jgi:hypothetical protein